MNKFSQIVKTATILLNRKGGFDSIKQLTLFSSGNFLAQVFMMVYAIIIARTLGPNHLGIYSGLYAILGVTITLVNFGFDVWMLKETQQHNKIRDLSGCVISIKLILGFFWGASCLLFLLLSRPQVFTWTLIILAVGDVLSESLFQTILTSWNIQSEIIRINVMLLISRFGKLSLLFLLLTTTKISLENILATRFIVSILVLLIGVLKLKPVINFRLFRLFISIVKRSSAFGFSEILAVIYGNIDIAILTFFSVVGTGYYSPASGIIHALFIIPNSVNVFLLPKITSLISSNKNLNLHKLTLKVILTFSIIGIFLSFAVFISAKLLIEILLGENYFLTGVLLTNLSPVLLFKSVSFGLALLIIVSGNQAKRLFPQLLVALTNIFMCVLLIPRFGVISVTWSYNICEILLLIQYAVIVFKMTSAYPGNGIIKG